MAAQRGAGGSSLTERLESRRRTVHAAQATAAIHDYTGHGTTRLLAALEVASDKAHGRCPRRRRVRRDSRLHRSGVHWPRRTADLNCDDYAATSS
jgi:hypothetical protein